MCSVVIRTSFTSKVKIAKTFKDGKFMTFDCSITSILKKGNFPSVCNGVFLGLRITQWHLLTLVSYFQFFMWIKKKMRERESTWSTCCPRILSKLFLLVIGSHLVDWSETVRVCGLFFHRVVNPLTPLIDQNWISPYNIMQTSDEN